MSARRKKISRRDIHSLCSDPGDLDGKDPRFDPPLQSNQAAPRKVLQLCGQVARTINEVLAGCSDDVLRDLMVESVVPAPSSVRLLVTLTPTPAVEGLDLDEARSRLVRAKGMLRAEVAASINRRKTPDLVFSVSAE